MQRILKAPILQLQVNSFSYKVDRVTATIFFWNNSTSEASYWFINSRWLLNISSEKVDCDLLTYQVPPDEITFVTRLRSCAEPPESAPSAVAAFKRANKQYHQTKPNSEKSVKEGDSKGTKSTKEVISDLSTKKDASPE